MSTPRTIRAARRQKHQLDWSAAESWPPHEPDTEDPDTSPRIVCAGCAKTINTIMTPLCDECAEAMEAHHD